MTRDAFEKKMHIRRNYLLNEFYKRYAKIFVFIYLVDIEFVEKDRGRERENIF